MSLNLTVDDQKFIDASNIVYSRGVPSDLTPLLDSSGNAVTSTTDSDGFYAEAFLDKTNNRVIIGYEGSWFNNLSYSVGSWILADGAIIAGAAPKAFDDALAFEERVASDTTDPIYVTGHSLGGAEAEYVASRETSVAGGITFGAPGLPNYFGGSTNANA